MKSSLLAALVVASLWPFHPAAWSQAAPTASKSQEISAFGAVAGGYTDFGPSAYEGLSAGADYTFFPRWRIAPSLEIRGSEVFGRSITEKTVQFGPRVQMDIRDRFHPYVDFLYGGAVVQFHPRVAYAAIGYTGDRGRALSFGGGVNIDITHHFGAKFDVQGENFKFGPSLFTGPDTAFTLSPIAVSVGVVYTVPFRKHNRREDLR